MPSEHFNTFMLFFHTHAYKLFSTAFPQNMPKLFRPIPGLISMPRKSMHYIIVNVNKRFPTWNVCQLYTNKATTK